MCGTAGVFLATQTLLAKIVYALRGRQFDEHLKLTGTYPANVCELTFSNSDYVTFLY